MFQKFYLGFSNALLLVVRLRLEAAGSGKTKPLFVPKPIKCVAGPKDTGDTPCLP